MLSLRWGTVTSLGQRLDELIRCEVDGNPCIAFPRLTGPVEEGDVVLVNTQARDLSLGSGGFDLVYANLTRGLDLPPASGAHVMTLPYTPAQGVARHAEEVGLEDTDLDGLPVVCCSLHSQLAPACAGLGRGARVALVQVGGGALPVSLSDAVRALKSRGLLAVAVAVAPCLDGDIQCVSVASALQWAKSHEYDAVVCAVGPGIVGTGTVFGHGGMAAADAANAATALGGTAIVAARFSLGDPRERHRGLSHHTRAILRLCLGDVAVPWPIGLGRPQGVRVTGVDVGGWEDSCSGLVLSHMGRGPSDDPWFFATAFAAGRYARDRLSSR